MEVDVLDVKLVSVRLVSGVLEKTYYWLSKMKGSEKGTKSSIGKSGPPPQKLDHLRKTAPFFANHSWARGKGAGADAMLVAGLFWVPGSQVVGTNS